MNYVQMLYRQKAVVILVLLTLYAIIFAPYFLTGHNLSNLFIQVSVYGIIAFAVTFVILNGQLDLSVGSVMAFSGIFMALLTEHMHVFLAVLFTILLGALIGLVIGLLVSYGNLHSFVVTLCAMFFFNGLALKLSDARPINVQDPFLNMVGNGKFFQIPVLVIIFFMTFVVGEYVLRKTKFGRNVYAVGGDEQVARFSGISVRFYKIIVFVISSAAAAFAGVLLAGMLNAASPFVGGAAALKVISCVVIGGTSLAGGEGGIRQTLIGVLILGVLDNSLALMNVHSFYQTFILGCLLVLVVGWDYYERSKKPELAA
ncbi:MAG TPA: ABC transporter permease [Pseudogracilibacillus sp.]|nr:ABC transporter permease [Pseudogracilibacillus sp.]